MSEPEPERAPSPGRTIDQINPLREPWELRIEPALLRFDSSSVGSFVVPRVHAVDELALRHGLFVQRMVLVRSRKRLFRLGPEVFAELLAWLAEFRDRFLQRDLWRLWLSLLVAFAVALNGPLGLQNAFAVYAPVVVATGLIVWLLPDRSAFEMLSVVFLGSAAIELWGVFRGTHKIRLVIASLQGLQCLMAAGYARLYAWRSPGARPGRLVGWVPWFALFAALVAGGAAALFMPRLGRPAEREPWHFESATLGVKVDLIGWHERRATPFPGRDDLAVAAFIRYERSNGLRGSVLHLMALDSPSGPPREDLSQGVRALAEELARNRLGNEALTLPTCEQIGFPDKVVARCTGEVLFEDQLDRVLVYVWFFGRREYVAVFRFPGAFDPARREADWIISGARPLARRPPP